MFNCKIFEERCKRLLQYLKPYSIAIVPSAAIKMRTQKTEYPYRPDNDFYYLTGFSEPNSIALFIKETETKGMYYLFCPEQDIGREQWEGKKIGSQEAIKQCGASQAFPITDFEKRLTDYLVNKKYLYYAWGRHPELDQLIYRLTNDIGLHNRRGIRPPHEIINIESWLHEQRLIKSKEEIRCIQKAVDILEQAMVRVMQQCKSGLRAYQLEAELAYALRQQGSKEESFEPIIASGAAACVLHNTQKQGLIRSGELVLVDAGCEYNYYTSDLTRTFPVNGRFTREQQALYEVVLAAQEAVIKKMKPGTAFHQLQMTAIQTLTDGLCDLKILKGNRKMLIKKEAYKTFYMHQVSHWIGMDVHDVGAYKDWSLEKAPWRSLKPGMVLSAEPGLYIKAGTPHVDPKWWNIGIRIEDDVLITPQGNSVLSSHLPKTVKEIEKLMAG